MSKHVISSYTKQSNNEQTDQEPMVMHIVQGQIAGQMYWCQLMAACPMSAIEQVNKDFDAQNWQLGQYKDK